MTAQLIHIVGSPSAGRAWLVQTLVNGLRGSGHGGALLDVLDAQTYSNADLRDQAIFMDRAVLVLADAPAPRHEDLQGSDLVIHVKQRPGAQADDPHAGESGQEFAFVFQAAGGGAAP